jgi:hypothetical protein
VKDYSMMDAALERLSECGPDMRNGFTNHAPMAVEALAAMGRADAVMPWLDDYVRGAESRPRTRQRIDPRHWRAALGQTDRFADWHAFFVDELGGAPWRDVLARWVERLAPALCASATHGVIRVGHAVRSLEESENAARVGELAEGLAYWAAAYQTLPIAPGPARPTTAGEAIMAVPRVPVAERTFTGTIVSSLEALADFAPFAPVLGALDTARDPATVLSDLTETFARVYLANARDPLGVIVFIHGVTSAAALRSLMPHLSDETRMAALAYAWQAGCGLYATFGDTPPSAGDADPPREDDATLVDMAIHNGDEHAIKFVEACLREHALNPSPAYLCAARHAFDVIGRH